MSQGMAAVALVGVSCGVCGQEAFQLIERQAVLSRSVKITVKCCPKCLRRVDGEVEDEETKAAVKNMSVAERKQAALAQSFNWASSWQGKHVLVTYDVGNGYGGTEVRGCQIKGMAFRRSNEAGGWGKVTVVLDEGERHRVGRDLRLDGYEWGLMVDKESDGGGAAQYSFGVSWGRRHERVLEEIQ